MKHSEQLLKRIKALYVIHMPHRDEAYYQWYCLDNWKSDSFRLYTFPEWGSPVPCW